MNEEPKKQPKRPHPAPNVTGPRDPNAIRTVIISGLPDAVDAKTLWKKVRKLEGAEKVDWPVKVGDVEDVHTGKELFHAWCSALSLYCSAYALFANPAAATAAVSKLHAHVFKGSLLSATLKKRLDTVAKVSKKAPQTEQQKPPVITPNRSSRLIVRNLPFGITEQDLRALFLPYGPIHSIDIPTIEDGKTEDDESERKMPRIKGFAFVWMLSKKDAEKAMEECNGRTIQAGMADTMMSDKQKRKKQRREEKKRNAAEIKEEESEEDPDEVKPSAQRVIAVDWALSKDKWEKEKAKLEEQQEEDVEMAANEKSEAEDAEGHAESDADSEDNNDADTSSDAGDESDADSDAESEDALEASDAESETPVKPTLPPPETGTTVFIRNVPFEATEDELRTLYVMFLTTLCHNSRFHGRFRAFGPLRYARITVDPETGRSRGTGFACFWNKEDADKIVQQSDILRAETTGGVTAQVRFAVTRENDELTRMRSPKRTHSSYLPC